MPKVRSSIFVCLAMPPRLGRGSLQKWAGADAARYDVETVLEEDPVQDDSRHPWTVKDLAGTSAAPG
jgi:hypothetical protein